MYKGQSQPTILENIKYKTKSEKIRHLENPRYGLKTKTQMSVGLMILQYDRNITIDAF